MHRQLTASDGASGGEAKRRAETFAGAGMEAVAPKWSDRYLTTNLEADLDMGLRNMANVHPEWVDKDCVRCHRACTDGAVEAPSGEFRGKALCHTCFGVLFKLGECAGCRGPVVPDGSEYIKQDNAIYHVHCFADERRCHVCRQPIINQAAINALGHDYHAKCFACGVCQTPLDSSYVAVKGVPQCAACAAEADLRRTVRYDARGATAVATPCKADVQIAHRSHTRRMLAAHSKTTSTRPVEPSAESVAAAGKRENLNKAVTEQQELLDQLKGVPHISLDDVCLKCKAPMLVCPARGWKRASSEAPC